MYGDDRKNDDERENGAFGAYSSPERGDGYRRPEFGEKNISEGDSDNNEAKNSDGEAVNNTDLGDGRAVGNAHPTANNAYPVNGYVSNGYTNNGYANNGYPNNGYQNNPYMGNGGGNGYYGGYNGYYPRGNSPVNGGYSPAVAENKRRLWVIPVAILLCLAMCVGCFFVGLSMVGRGAPYGDDEQITDSDGAGNGGSGGNGGNSEGSSDTGNKSPYLGGGEVELEQLPADSIYYTIPSVVSATKDTVVEITTETVTTGSFWGQYVTQGAGSGVIIKSYPEKGESGACGTYIVTNNHVIDGAYSISVTLTSGAEYIAHLVATDPQTDIAVLHIDEANLPTAKLGSSSQLVAGQTVVVIGNPLGSLGGSVSSGIVSCTERNIEMDNRVMKLIQTTAAVNPGNSGGAMFDLEGKLVGVVNSKYSDEQIEGIGFAIPIDIAAAVAEDLINFGYVTGRPNHGITAYYGYCTYRNVRIYYENTYVQGVWASAVAEGSDADKAGMEAFDQIVSIIGADGKTYVFNSASEASIFLSSLKVGDVITVNAYRYAPKSSVMGTSFERTELSFTVTVTEYKGA